MALVYRDFFGAIVPQSAATTTTITGGAGTEPLVGTGAADLLVGGGGGHLMIGGAGDDTYQVNVSADSVLELDAPGVDTVQVRNVKVFTLTAGVENLSVFGKMTAFGNDQANLIIGNIYAQTLTGGGGNDVISGGAGADVFVFGAGSGFDVVTDFSSSQADRVRILDHGFRSFAQVTGAMTQVGSDVVLRLSDTDAIKFLNTTIAGFQSTDFQLASDASNQVLSFAAEFDAPLSFYDPQTGAGVWNTRYESGDASGLRAYTSHTLRNNGEKQIYVDAAFAGSGDAALGLNPFTVADGVLDIAATVTTDAEKSSLWYYKYKSGLLTTADSFAQTYGYFEVRAQLPEGQGLWPAFWLLPQDGTRGLELDVLEQIGGATGYFTSHSNIAGVAGTSALVPNATSQFHTYGLLWTNRELVWYVDGGAVASMATPADLNRPMYMLLNQAVGGTFPGNPSADFAGADLKVDYVRAYSLNAGGGGDGDLGVRMAKDVVGAGQRDHVGYVVTGLDVGASGIVTFTDSSGRALTIDVAANGAAVADLSTLAPGAVNVAIAMRGPDEALWPGAGQGFLIDANLDSDLKVSTPFSLDADQKAAARFTLTGLDEGSAATVTITDGRGQQVVVNPTVNGVFTADLSGLADGKLLVVLSQSDADGRVLAGVGGSVALDSTADDLGDLALALTTVANARNSGHLTFNLAGLDKDAAGVVTFSDSVGGVVTARLNNNSAPFVDLTSLADGLVTVSAMAIDDVGNRASAAPVTLTLDTRIDQGGDLAFSLPLAAINALEKTYAPYLLAGLDADAVALVTFTDSLGGRVTVTGVNGGGRVDLSGLAAGPITVDVAVSDMAGNSTTLAGALVLAPGAAPLPSSALVFAPASGGATLGGAGADLIIAGAGNDLISGGEGVNTVSYNAAASGVTVSLGVTGAQVTGGSGKDTLSGVQNLIGSAFADRLSGAGDANTLLGGAGDDSLSGGGGDDLLAGGSGADSLNGGNGVDTASYFDAVSGVSVNLALTGAQDTGGAGIDTLTAIESLIGSGFGDLLTGSNGDNRLSGGAGDDVLTGGLGADLLCGGLGADRFVYKSIVESKMLPGSQDQILDFSAAQGDRLDLSGIDASTVMPGDDAFSLTTSFTRSAGQLIQTASGDGYLVQGDVNGDGVADFAVLVHSVSALTAADIIL